MWIDETATYTHMTRSQGRAPRGQRAYALKRRKGRRYTLVVAMSQDGVVAKRLIQGGMKFKDWKEFLTQDLLPALGEEPHWIQMDNLDLHHQNETLMLLRAAGHAQSFQPPYSPESNPLEEGFSVLKSHLRSRGAVTKGKLEEAIEEGLALWTPRKIAGWIWHAIKEVAKWPD